MTTIETYELTFRRLLDQALAAHGRKSATPAQVDRCFKLSLSAGEAAAILAPHQSPSDETIFTFVAAPQVREGARDGTR